jgi:hypothetical protein
MLNLPNVTETKLVTSEEDYLIHAESVVSIRDCPHCRLVSGSRKFAGVLNEMSKLR